MADGSKLNGKGAMPPAPKVVIGIPSGDDFMADFGMALSAMVAYCVEVGIPVAVKNHKRTVISFARNDLCNFAIAHGADYLFMVDSDMRFPPDTLQRLLLHDKDIACATYNRRVPPYSTLGFLKGEARPISGGLEEADFMPGGVMLIKVDVLRKLGYPWFFETYKWDGETSQASLIKMLADWSVMDMPLEVRSAIASNPVFARWLIANEDEALKRFDPTSKTISEDYNFCRKARKGGFQIWCDFDLTFKIGHIGTHLVTCLNDEVKGIPAAGTKVGTNA